MWNKVFGFAIVTALVLGTVKQGDVSPTTYQQVSTESVAEQVVHRSVKIHTVIEDKLAIGSGVMYEKDGEMFVLTAAHVIGEGKGLIIIEQIDPNTDETVTTMGQVVASDADSDWTIIRSVGDSRCVIGGTAFSTSPPRIGQGVYAAGCPLGEENTVTEGIIANTRRGVEWNHDKHLVVTCNGTHGSSGGGVYDASTGKCIGIVVRLNSHSHLLYVVSIETILNDLREMGKSSLLPT